MTRNEVLCRYRHLYAISTRHHSAALKFLGRFDRRSAVSEIRRHGGGYGA